MVAAGLPFLLVGSVARLRFGVTVVVAVWCPVGGSGLGWGWVVGGLGRRPVRLGVGFAVVPLASGWRGRCPCVWGRSGWGAALPFSGVPCTPSLGGSSQLPSLLGCSMGPASSSRVYTRRRGLWYRHQWPCQKLDDSGTPLCFCWRGHARTSAVGMSPQFSAGPGPVAVSHDFC